MLTLDGGYVKSKENSSMEEHLIFFKEILRINRNDRLLLFCFFKNLIFIALLLLVLYVIIGNRYQLILYYDFYVHTILVIHDYHQ